MKRLLIVILVAAGLWAAYWFAGAAGAKSAFANWFEIRRGEGWVAEYADLSVQGFPNRFDTTLTAPVLADPHSGWSWEAPFFQVFALSYQPNHVIAVWPDTQLLATPNAKYDISSAKMQASLVTEGTDLALVRANLAADTLQIAQRDGDATNMTALNVALLRQEDGTSYRFALKADDLAPSRSFRALVDKTGGLPRTFSAFDADITMTFDQPWNRLSLEEARPQLRALKISLAEARWGDLELALAGELQIDAQGWPDGQVTIKARNWREIVSMSVAAGILPQALADQLSNGLQMVAGMSGNPNTLDLPLDFRGGGLYFGPIPLGPAPNFTLR